MERIALIDADIPIYRYAAVNEKSVQWDEGGDIERFNPPFEMVVAQLEQHMDSLCDQLQVERVIVCLSEPDREKNWRRKILPSYKTNRSNTVEPEYRQRLSEYLEHNYECFRRDTLEGDDVLGILATHPTLVKGRKVIVSIDKDMQTIPTRRSKHSENWLFNPNKDRKPRKVTEEQADHFWMTQVITGDTTDGYKGLPGRGPKYAEELLGLPEEGHLDLWWDLVLDAYEQRGLCMDDALVQAQVARICRAEDYNYDTKEVIPWGT